MSEESGSNSVLILQNKRVQMVKKISCTWKVEDFATSFEKGVDFQLKSPDFSSTDDGLFKWYISIYPNGKDEDHSKFVSLFLRLVSGRRDVAAIFNLGIKSIYDKMIHTKKYEAVFTPRGLAYGAYDFIKRQDLLERIQNEDIKIDVDIEFEADESDINYQMPVSFATMLDDSTFSDATLHVNGKKISVHRNILAARCEKFAGMLKKNAKRIELHDISYETTISILQFVYANTVDIENLKMAETLIEAAKTYCLDELSSICFDYLVTILNESNVVYIYVIADAFNVKGLKDYCSRFISDHIDTVYNEKDMQQMIKEKPKYATCLKELMRMHKPPRKMPLKK